MKIFKKKAIIISIFMAIIVSLSFLMSGYINSKTEIAVRNVNVSEIGTLSYEEKAAELKEKFDSIETFENDDYIGFCGEVNVDKYNLLNTNYENEDVKEKYSSQINKNTDEITIEKDVIVDGTSVGTISESFSTWYDETNDRYLLIDQDGNEIDVFTQLDEDNMNECFALFAFIATLTIKQIIAVCVVTAITIVVAANAKTIANDIRTLVDGVRDGVISFWERIKLMLGQITAIALAGTISLTEALAKEIYEVAKKRKDCYLLCGTITGAGFIPIMYKFTNYENARNWIKRGGSVWSPFSSTAERCVEGAGFVPGGKDELSKQYTPYMAEIHKISPFSFYHYHTLRNHSYIRVNNSAHSFFGLPVRK